jgi:hypothetical protein
MNKLDVGWIQFAQDRVQWQPSLSTKMNRLVPRKAENLAG